MQDITHILDHYRVAARSIWNAGFWSESELRNWNSWDRFERIKKLLFEALIVARLKGEDHIPEQQGSMPFILYVIPTSTAPVMINKPRTGDSNWYWDDPVREISPSDASLHFLDYFDWNRMDYADFQYYRVRIAEFRAHPDLIGREALIQRINAKVFVVNDEVINL